MGLICYLGKNPLLQETKVGKLCIFCILQDPIYFVLAAKESVCRQETRVPSLVSKIPEEGMSHHSCILAQGIPMDRGAWRAAIQGVNSPWGCKVLDMTDQLHTANFSRRHIDIQKQFLSLVCLTTTSAFQRKIKDKNNIP